MATEVKLSRVDYAMLTKSVAQADKNPRLLSVQALLAHRRNIMGRDPKTARVLMRAVGMMRDGKSAQAEKLLRLHNVPFVALNGFRSSLPRPGADELMRTRSNGERVPIFNRTCWNVSVESHGSPRHTAGGARPKKDSFHRGNNAKVSRSAA